MNRKQLIAIVALLAIMLCLPIKAAKTYWGYCNGVDPVAFGTKNTGKCAIYIPADVAQVYKGFTVTAVKYGLAAQASDVEVFITKDLNADPIVTKKAAVSNLYKGWNEVALTTPYEIDGEGFYIGYSYSGSAVSMGVTSTFSENACWADLGDGWKNYTTEMGETAKALAIQARITGDNLPLDLMLYTENANLAVQKGEPCKFDFSVKNLSAVVVRNLQVGYSIDGGEETVCDFKATMGSNIDKSFTIEHDGFDVVGNHTLKLRVVSINGKDDAYAPNSEQTLALSVKNSVPVQRLVVEEGTGTWCQFCPKGIVGLRKASEAYPNHFIGIAIHKFNASDPMFASDYANVGLSSAPSCVINRNGRAIDPYYGSNKSILDDLAAAVKEVPMIGVDVNGVWNADSTVVTVNANIDSYVSGKYEIAYVLTADNLTANKSSWRQSNYYTNFTKQQLIDQGEEDLAIFAKDGDKGSKYFNWEFMDVLIGSSYSNASNLAAPVTLTANETTTTSYDVAMPTKAALKNALKATGRKVAVIAIVIDQQTGQVVNAGKSYNIVSNTTGIQGVVDNAKYDAVEVARYNASGQRIKAPVMGINIIKMSDGRTVKVIVK